jgi:2-hydroxy-6-oxonona-2,4-dienedioate hydrolase
VSILSLIFQTEQHESQESLVKSRAPILGITQGDNFGFKRSIVGDHVFMETGVGRPLIFCHGVFGSFRNFAEIGRRLSSSYRVIVPCLPLYDAPLNKCTVEELSVYLEAFIEDLKLKDVVLAGNSMGGGTVLLYAIRNPSNVSRIILFSSSGLSFIPMRGGALKLKDRSYVRSLLDDIFYSTPPFSDEEFEEVYQVMQNKAILLRILKLTRSTKSNYLHDKLHLIRHIPTSIVWGLQDTVTPPFIAEEFKAHLPDAELHYLDRCGHAPSYEKPDECAEIIESFLSR